MAIAKSNVANEIGSKLIIEASKYRIVEENYTSE
jgi:hypothetical protein